MDSCYGCSECIGCGRNRREAVSCCDQCGEPASYSIDGTHYCENCIEQAILDKFDVKYDKEARDYLYNGEYYDSLQYLIEELASEYELIIL